MVCSFPNFSCQLNIADKSLIELQIMDKIMQDKYFQTMFNAVLKVRWGWMPKKQSMLRFVMEVKRFLNSLSKLVQGQWVFLTLSLINWYIMSYVTQNLRLDLSIVSEHFM